MTESINENSTDIQEKENSYRIPFYLVFFILGLSLVINRPALNILNGIHDSSDVVFVVMGSLLLLAVLAVLRKRLIPILSSLPFAVVLMAVLTGATVLGTFLPQLASRESYVQIFGENGSKIIFNLGMNDLFHSFWFTVLLALLGISLVAVVIHNRAWRMEMWGHLLGHAGVVVVLLGGLVYTQKGWKGRIDIHEGMQVGTAQKTNRAGRVIGEPELGFQLRLNKFDIERYDPEYRLYVYGKTKDGQNYTALRSHDAEVSEKHMGQKGFQYRILEIYPDFHREYALVEDESGRPALSVSFQAGHNHSMNLFTQNGRNQIYLPDSETLVRFYSDKPDESLLPKKDDKKEEKHLLHVTTDGGKRIYEVAIGDRIQLEDSVITVEKALLDAIFDTKSGEAKSRSAQPNNPAMQVTVELKDGEEKSSRWLFAKMPNFGMHGRGEHSGPALVYEYVPERTPPKNEMIVIAGTREVMKYRDGELTGKDPIPEDGMIRIADSATLKFFEKAREEEKIVSKSKEWNNPAILLETKDDEHVHRNLLRAGHEQPVWSHERDFAITFEAKRNDVKDYRSHVSVIEDGQELFRRVIEVNDPLVHKGISIYQSNYRQDDPTYSGFLIVYDPGIEIAYLGMIMISLGVVFAFYIRPRLEDKKGESHV